MKFFVKKQKIVIFAIVFAVIAVSLTAMLPLVAHGEEFNDVNPELLFEKIESDLEVTYSEAPYVHKSTLSQGSGKYKIVTNSMAVWRYVDDCAFAYKKYNVKGSGSDYIDLEVTINSAPKGDTTTHHNASCGIMLRSGLGPEAAEVFLHVRAIGILAVYRTNDGNNTLKQQLNYMPTYPITLKMHKSGQKVTMSFIGSNGVEVKFPYPVQLTAPGPIYAGIAAHSCDPKSNVTSNFSNLKISGVGTYTDDGKEDEESSTPSEEYVEEDSPLASKIALRETFTDGDLYNTPETSSNPVWTRDTNGAGIRNIEGNRVLDLSFVDMANYAGSQEMTDYAVSMDFQFTPECNPDVEAGSNTLRLYARHTDIPFYGNSDYAAVITEGYKLSLYKRSYFSDELAGNGYLLVEAESSKELSEDRKYSVSLREYYKDADFTLLGDKTWHTLKLRVLDNTLEVYLDDMSKPIIEYTDNGEEEKTQGKRVFAKGSIGICALETAVYIDNITVEKLEDTFGGDYDNKIGGNWNDKVPDYVTEYDKKY